MAIKYQICLADDFIDRRDNLTYYKKSGKRVIESVMQRPNSFGLVGSDVVDEWFYDSPDVLVSAVGPMINDNGEQLRFALIESSAAASTDSYVTAYPNTARRMLGPDVDITVAGGSIEAEIDDLCIPGFELVQSGESVRNNELTITTDNIALISLCLVVAKAKL